MIILKKGATLKIIITVAVAIVIVSVILFVDYYKLISLPSGGGDASPAIQLSNDGVVNGWNEIKIISARGEHYELSLSKCQAIVWLDDNNKTTNPHFNITLSDAKMNFQTSSNKGNFTYDDADNDNKVSVNDIVHIKHDIIIGTGALMIVLDGYGGLGLIQNL